ncbi:MAG: 1-deoxy-D-xylulose-5-phosphate synthase [Gammaproteobacteria bacterium]|jgi:1-deoxy-D-xylulose-5-phosphate synthase|nr:1-deoxy-D-xylulose-5-phosphate synthase [Gammaproteobacteria bacterium]MBP6480603.1 1-deoxy-D-xylulose-5-phosphate synthase [Pseudomonadales bacterium]MBP7909455.1 1-deoxy-D-xylulose-5-phosphate synthase [Pseudomonadales bacterium]
MKLFQEIPVTRPATPLLDRVTFPADLRELDEAQLLQLANELREFLLYTVGQTGGHFGAGLGVVELSIALHYLFDTPRDRLVWDVGHQSYPHKILTGRREAMLTIRKAGGLAAFNNRAESEYDCFGVGHSSTSISAALGMALAARARGEDRRAVAIIGDGAMTAGMAFEALNHASHTGADLLVILNDNQMSISRNEGGLASYFARIWASRSYNHMREAGKRVLSRLPGPALEIARRTEEHMKGMVAPGTLFEELGFNYIGPVDGHDLPSLLATLRNVRELKGAQLLHVMTVKGKGFAPAERDPVGYHAINKIDPAPRVAGAKPVPVRPKYQEVFGDWLCDMAWRDERLVGITPAMCEGSGMVEFARRFPARFHDVAIAEQHAVTLAAGLACENMKPVVAIYSSFLQRGYDQLIHDVALQNLDVLFAIDRAGLVGEDGPTHAGSFDLGYLRCVPNMLVMAPSDEDETRKLLSTGFLHHGPAAVRYPRGTGPGATIDPALEAVAIGKGVLRRAGREVAILGFGSMVAPALAAASALEASVADMRFVKPLDEELILELCASHSLLVTVEENAVAGGAGAAVAELLAARGIVMPLLVLGLPDRFLEHGKPQQMLHDVGLDAEGIEAAIRERLSALRPSRRGAVSQL